MTSFMLKIFAMVTMFCDHLGYAIYGKLSWMNYIGRLAFPVFAFQISEGYSHTKNLKKYFTRILIFAIISQIPFIVFHFMVSKIFYLNIFFTLLMGLLAIFSYDKIPNKILGLLVVASCAFIAEITNMDYGYWGVLVIFMFYICKNNKTLMSLSWLGLVLLQYLPRIIKYDFYYVYILLAIFTFLAIFPILLYNKKQGRKIKYLLYIFYPAHLLVVFGIHCLLH